MPKSEVYRKVMIILIKMLNDDAHEQKEKVVEAFIRIIKISWLAEWD
jgi:hypothetical protein